ncbi:hypothetical protein GCM10027299_45310 [Larkinella ripae]
MKLRHYLLIGWGLAMSLTACKHDQDLVNPENPDEPGIELPDESGTETKVGQPKGNATSKTIGPEGGTIATADGKATLTLPAGALDKATSITIQPITNENPHGLGQAYRFSPEGLKFSKPATLTFQYDAAKMTSERAENFGVACQRDNKVWYDIAGSSVNTSRHEISVPMEHFSDWTPYELAQFDFAVITSGIGQGFSLQPGQSVDLYAGLLTYNANYPKDAKEKPLKQARGFGENWKLIGEGTLKDRSEGATYTAPARVPKQNPVLVTTELTFPGKKFKLMLSQKIYIGLETYFDLSVNNFPREVSNFATTIIGKETYLSCVVGDETLMLRVGTTDLAVGKYPFYSGASKESETNKTTAVFGLHDPAVEKRWMSHYYDSCPGKNVASPGSVQIEEVEFTNGKKFVKGTFFAIVYMAEGVCNKNWKLEQQPLTGSFRMEVLKP